MLNCLSQKPIEGTNSEDEKLLFSLLYKHLEDIPLENPQNLVHVVNHCIVAIMILIIIIGQADHYQFSL